MPNHLQGQSSPYLLQHVNNPVDWYPWGSDAIELARAQDKPIFLSIGYSACHWCHVMEHESFESEATAAILNEHFISIKVDREERTDLDQIYMNAVMAIRNGQGGWPLSAFLTPELHVFFGGTYWPPVPRMGMPAFSQVLHSVVDAFRNRRDAVNQQSREITEFINRAETSETATGEDGEPVAQQISEALLQSAVQRLENGFDYANGGFGAAPKFPHAMDLSLLMRMSSKVNESDSPPRSTLLEMVDRNLTAMYEGGIYDHLGGGFSRYSVDEKWLVPHFEKMLYDNALLTYTNLEMFKISQQPLFATVASETVDYVLKHLTDQAGGFYSTEDADSEGVEGKFYVWTAAEIRNVLGEAAFAPAFIDLFCELYDVTPAGNFEGSTILNLTQSVESFARHKEMDLQSLQSDIVKAKAELLAVRAQRIRPGLDDKVIVSWNGMMISAMSKASSVLERPDYYTAAARAADFILEKVTDESGRLLHTWRNGNASLLAYLDDYACFADGLIELYLAGFETRYLHEAIRLTEEMVSLFHDETEGGFFFTASDAEQLIARIKPNADGSVPSGNGMAATLLIRLGRLIQNQSMLEMARRTLENAVSLMQRSPMATGQSLIGCFDLLFPGRDVVLAGPDRGFLVQIAQRIQQRAYTDVSVVIADDDAPANQKLQQVLGSKPAIDGQPTMYVCHEFTCKLPVVGAEAITEAVEAM